MSKKTKNNLLIQPFLKWAGGKRQLLPEIKKFLPKLEPNYTYFEPFLGAGAVLFNLQPKKAVVNDLNTDLINCYKIIKSNLSDLLLDISKHKNEEKYFYEIRELDRKPEYQELSSVEKASRIIFLNKTCFNGLFRVNSQGQFNAPFGNYKNPTIADESVLNAVSRYLNENNIMINNGDFKDSLKTTKKNDFVYLDPPYDPISETSSFTGYNLNQFYKDDQKRLKEVVDDLSKKGCKIMLSNSATEFIKDLYKDYKIEIVSANRNINSDPLKRGKIDEFLILNYQTN